jgi:hypothetical protein
MNYLPSGWIAMTIQWDIYIMEVMSSSSVLDVSFDQVKRKLTVMVSGEDGTEGETNITIPIALVTNVTDILIEIDGKTVEGYDISNNGTHYLIHVGYHHSTHALSTSFDKSAESKGDGPIPGGDLTDGNNIYILAGAAVGMIALVVLILARKKRIPGLRRKHEDEPEGQEEQEEPEKEEDSGLDE